MTIELLFDGDKDDAAKRSDWLDYQKQFKDKKCTIPKALQTKVDEILVIDIGVEASEEEEEDDE